MRNTIFLFLLNFTFLSSYCSYEEDLKQVLNSYIKRDPNCTFKNAEINTTTIKSFPQCSNVYGIIVINEKTDLTVPKLKLAFKNLRKLYGGIIIENTNWTSISIFPTDQYIWLYCENYVFHIRNNSKLTDGQLLLDLDWLPNKNEEQCDFRVENNLQLDMEYYCESENLEKFLKIRTSGNLKDCGCQGDQITSETLLSYSKCTKLFNGFKLSNITDLSSLSALSNIQEIRGDIDIQNTSIQNLDFLENILRWKVRSTEKLVINLKNNLNMTRLPMKLLGILHNFVYGVILVNFENSHPEFCVTVEEILQVLKFGIAFVNFHAKVCDEIGDIGELVLCRFESMDDLPNNCEIILGNLIIEKGDEDDFTKLAEVFLIIGRVIIQNTEFKNLIEFGTHMGISVFYTTDSDPVFQINGNRKLKNPTMENLANIITRDEKRAAVFQDNHPGIFSTGVCRLVKEFYGDRNLKFRIRLNYIGGDCGESIKMECFEYNRIWRLFISILVAQFVMEF